MCLQNFPENQPSKCKRALIFAKSRGCGPSFELPNPVLFFTATIGAENLVAKDKACCEDTNDVRLVISSRTPQVENTISPEGASNRGC